MNLGVMNKLMDHFSDKKVNLRHKKKHHTGLAAGEAVSYLVASSMPPLDAYSLAGGGHILLEVDGFRQPVCRAAVQQVSHPAEATHPACGAGEGAEMCRKAGPPIRTGRPRGGCKNAQHSKHRNSHKFVRITLDSV